MAFNKMRRQPLAHGLDPQVIDMDFGWVQNGAADTSDPQYWQQYVQGAVTAVGTGAIASLQRTAAGTIKVYMDPSICGEKLVRATAVVMSDKTGYISSYNAQCGQYVAPIASTGSYNGTIAAPGTIMVYTTLGTSGVKTDISSLSLASVRVFLRWSDADY